MGERLDIASLKLPPHSSEAEQAVLGCLLFDPGCFDAVGPLLKQADFYDVYHGMIFGAIAGLIGHGNAVDVVTVFVDLQRVGNDEAVGGINYLNTLCQGVSGASRAAAYAKLVREKSVLRQVLAAGEQIAERAYSAHGESADEVLDFAERSVLAIAERGGRGVAEFKSASELMAVAIDHVQRLADNPDEVQGVPTGFADLDRLLGGLQKSDLIILAARPSMGKTALALDFARHAALDIALPVAVFSMEMSAAQLALRLVGSVGRIDSMRLRTGRLHDEDWPRLTEAVETVGKAPLHIFEQANLRVSDVRGAARRLARKCGGLGLIVVDYLQLMSGGGDGGRDDNRATELADVSRGLKALAKELDCPVVALSQLNRQVETRNDKRPLMSDLRDSGAIEQDADVVMFIYRDDYYNKDSREPGITEVIVSKARNGPTGVVKLAFLKALTRFENLQHGAGGL